MVVITASTMFWARQRQKLSVTPGQSGAVYAHVRPGALHRRARHNPDRPVAGAEPEGHCQIARPKSVERQQRVAP